VDALRISSQDFSKDKVAKLGNSSTSKKGKEKEREKEKKEE